MSYIWLDLHQLSTLSTLSNCVFVLFYIFIFVLLYFYVFICVFFYFSPVAMFLHLEDLNTNPIWSCGTMCVLYKWPQGAFRLFPDTAPPKAFSLPTEQNIRQSDMIFVKTFTLADFGPVIFYLKARNSPKNSVKYKKSPPSLIIFHTPNFSYSFILLHLLG